MTTTWAWVRSITAGAYAWQVHGWGWAIMATLFMGVVAPGIVTFGLAAIEMRRPLEEQDPFQFFRLRERIVWGLWLLVMIAIGATGATW